MVDADAARFYMSDFRSSSITPQFYQERITKGIAVLITVHVQSMTCLSHREFEQFMSMGMYI